MHLVLGTMVPLQIGKRVEHGQNFFSLYRIIFLTTQSAGEPDISEDSGLPARQFCELFHNIP